MRYTLLRSIALGLSLVGSAQAATTTIDFNTDPQPGPPPALYRRLGPAPFPDGPSGNGEWRPSGGASGAANDGYLAVTDSRGGQQSCVVFKDLENGLVVKAFTFECDLRIGGGTARPADGFSINYATAGSRVLELADQDQDPTYQQAFGGTDDEPNGLPEEGVRGGLGIGFDTWQSFTIVGVQDVVGVSVRLDNVLIAQFPVPLKPDNVFTPGEPNPGGQGTAYEYNEVPYRNLSTNDPNYALSMQTGALSSKDLNADGTVDAADANHPQPDFDDLTWPDWTENLRWEKFRAEVLEDGKVKVFWKGVELTPPGGLQTDFVPSAGRIVFAGRTGGAWEVHHVDNIVLVTEPADKIIIGNATGIPTGFTIPITDSGPSILDLATVQLQLNGNAVTPTFTSKPGDITTLVYSGPTNLTAGTTNRLSVTATDTRGISATGTRSFVVPSYSSVPTSYAVASANTPGFKLKVHQLAAVQALPNSVARAERQLHGDIGENVAFVTPGADGYVTHDTVINFNQDAPANAGNFNSGNGFEDQPIPGIDLLGSPHTDNIAMEILTYIEFPTAGAYQLIFNSDDGFRTLAGNKAVDVVASPIVSQADVGRGATDTLRNIYVAQAGIYPFRTIWFEGGGGANLEWVAVNLQTGVKALINDSTTTGSLKAFRVATGTFPAAVTYAYPDRSSGNPYFPTDPITIEITDGTTQVNGPSIQLSVNDAPVSVTPTKVGAVTKIQYSPPNPWASGSNNKITLVWSDNSTPAVVSSNSWNFTVRSWVTVPATAAVPAASVNTANVGFKVRTHKADQQNDLANSSARAIEQLAGVHGANKMDTSAFAADGYYAETTTINYEQGALPANTPYDSLSVAPADSGNFIDTAPMGQEDPDRLFPGMPITDATYATLVYSNKWSDNLAMEILTVLELQPGFYWDGVNSDDGFKVSFAANPLDVTATVANVFEGGKGASDVTGLYRITQAGLYPVRVIWYEGGGGASIEWFLQNTLNYQRILVNDVNTAGYVKAYQYPVTTPPAAYVKSVTPAAGSQAVLGVGLPRVGLGKKVEPVIVDGSSPIDQNSIKLMINGAEVSPITKNKVGNETTVTYNQPLPANQLVTVQLLWTDTGPRSAQWSFTTGPLPGNTFVIEAEDFNHGGGQTQPAASMMPYFGNAYTNLGALLDIDYSRPNQGEEPLYRIGEVNNVPMDATGDIDRGGWNLSVNYKLGWIGSGQWYNYTRTFPAGSYNVYAAVSHGDPPASGTIGGSLQLVTAGATTTNQTVTQLGTFAGPRTGGWGANRLVPLMNGGTVASVALSGQQTIRYTTSDGDYDFLAFVPAAATGPQITGVTLAGASITVTWQGGGTLQSASSLTDPLWADIQGATTGTYNAQVTGTEMYYRVRAEP